jgi:HEXXH motif-containing protein
MTMNVRSHHLPDDVFGTLAAGEGGIQALHYLAAAQYSKHLLLLRGVVDTAEAFGHPQAAQARRAYDLLAAIQEQVPGDVDAVVRHPAVGAWAWRTLRALHGGRAMVGADPVQNSVHAGHTSDRQYGHTSVAGHGHIAPA